ncbi:DUF6143 family protein [Bacillus carboniphilus]|uniref:DUF6143 family protein n=1 Tax=Bacillus carboniphilus TaxID=86663 RepID=A0ABY9JY97_9BACI|nr:DUF6143 family protein [Bacillus carboniphilus]WLR44366.1 DUF6143 family protein [Bacillus carboniphilus]
MTVGNDAFESTKGVLFAGSSSDLIPNTNTNAWVQLFNPPDSNVNLFINVIVLANFSTDLVRADLYLNSEPPGAKFESTKVTSVNVGSPNQPMGQIHFNPSVQGVPVGGTNIGSRALTPHSTFFETAEGRIILEPGTNLVLFIGSRTETVSQIGFEWWEGKEIVC